MAIFSVTISVGDRVSVQYDCRNDSGRFQGVVTGINVEQRYDNETGVQTIIKYLIDDKQWFSGDLVMPLAKPSHQEVTVIRSNPTKENTQSCGCNWFGRKRGGGDE